MLNPPAVDPDEYETELKFYGSFWVIATFFTAASMMLSVTIVVQLVTIKYDSKSVSTALGRNNAQVKLFMLIGMLNCIVHTHHQTVRMFQYHFAFSLP